MLPLASIKMTTTYEAVKTKMMKMWIKESKSRDGGGCLFPVVPKYILRIQQNVENRE